MGTPLEMYYFRHLTLPDTTSIIELILQLRGLRCEMGIHPDDKGRHEIRDPIGFIVYAETLMRFQEKYRGHRGFQRALCEAIRCCGYLCDTDVRTQYEDVLRRMTTRVVTRRRWGLIKVSTKLLGLQTRAVITANHPCRKRDRKEFEIE
jgi:hypothetical protein